MAHHLSGGNHVVRDFDGLGLSGGSRREVIELLGGRDSVNVKIHQNKNAYGNLGLGSFPTKNDSLKRDSGHKRLPSSAGSSRV